MYNSLWTAVGVFTGNCSGFFDAFIDGPFRLRVQHKFTYETIAGYYGADGIDAAFASGQQFATDGNCYDA